jgi:PAS domain S-box-containing protein
MTILNKDPGQRVELLEMIQTSGNVRNYGIEMLRKDGRSFYSSLNASRLSDSEQDIYLYVIEDVSERVRTEIALQERVKELNCLYGMSELLEWPGASLEEILQGTVELIPAAWQYPEIACARILLKDQEFRTENFAVTPWQQNVDIIMNGEPIGAVEVYYLEERAESEEGVFLSEEWSLIKEISERLSRTIDRIMVDEALHASEEKYRDLVENISDVIYTADSEGKITYVSPAIESLLGYKPADILGQSFVQFIATSDLKRGKDNFQQLALGKFLDPNEYQVLTKSGEICWIRVSSQPILEEDQVIGVQGVLTDITQRKRAEDQLEQAAALAERERLARDLHDSVTQSLYSINLQSDATIMALSSGKIEGIEKRLQTLKEIARESMSELRMLIYELHPSILEEAGLVAAMRQRLDTVESRSGIQVDLQVEGEQRLPIAVEKELFRISLEGLNNVMKHAKANEILIWYSFEPDRCRLTIKDDGVGFDLKPTYHYRGYGLANIKERLEQIGGELTIITEPGKGTTLDIEVVV